MQGFFKTLMRPDQEEDPERTLVARAANVLQVGEFQLLQLAYYEWHGHELPQDDCGKLFQAYMLHGEIPAWARNFATWVLRQDEIDMIDGREESFHRFDHDYVTHVPQGVLRFVLASATIAFILFGGILLSHVTVDAGTSVLPPFFDENELDQSR